MAFHGERGALDARDIEPVCLCFFFFFLPSRTSVTVKQFRLLLLRLFGFSKDTVIYLVKQFFVFILNVILGK